MHRKCCLYIITGCTASGKSAYAVELAKKKDAEIVSCDSLLVYRGMDIGTAKPSRDMLDDVRHHCIDIVSPIKQFDVSKYISCARDAINDILSRKKNIIVCGGSGFYLKSFFFPVVDAVTVSDDIVREVEELFEQQGLSGIVDKLISVNRGVIPKIDINNPRRVMSALKRCLASGRTLYEMQNEFLKQKCAFCDCDKMTLMLDVPDDVLKRRVSDRTYQMIKDGLIEEVECLCRNYGQLSDNAAMAIGYRETINWLKNKTTVYQLRDDIVLHTMQLVKKQKTWLKKQIPVDVVRLVQ